MRLIGKLFKGIFYILLCVVLFFSCFVLYKKANIAGKRKNIPVLRVLPGNFEYADLFGYEPFVVVSTSMVPTLNVNDIVVAKHTTNKNDYKVGDIAIYKDGGDIIIHRIKKAYYVEGDQKWECDMKDANYLEFKGDNNVLSDELVPVEQLYALYIFKVPKLGAISTAFR